MTHEAERDLAFCASISGKLDVIEHIQHEGQDVKEACKVELKEVRAHLAPRNCPRLLCNLEIHLISKFLKTMTVWHSFWRLVLGSTFWELMVTFGNGLKPFLPSLFNSCNIFSHSLTLAHTCSCSVMQGTNCHTMASIHSPPGTWVEHPLSL